MVAIRVLLADDHMLVRVGLRMILGEYSDIQIVGEAKDGFQAIELAEEIQPDVILMDLRMPVLDGFASTERIKAQWPGIAIVILTAYHDDELMIRSLQAGAQGFLLKDTNGDALVDTIRAAFRGDTLFQPDMLSRLLLRAETHPALLDRPLLKQELGPRSSTQLSQRELEILKLVATGGRNKEIAFELKISQSTVKAHLDSIFNKLGVDSRTAAVSAASQFGLLVEALFMTNN